jgi:hypothetical protein
MIKAATIVLVHGAWADGSSWNKVIPLLQAKGLPVVAVQLPLTSIDDDLAVTKRTISQPGKVAAVIEEAAAFVAAAAP